MPFKKLNTKIYQKNGPVITPDYIYWKQLGTPVLIKEFGPIDYVDFSPIEPHHFAVTCSVRVQVYNPVTKLVVKNLSRFRENAYGAVFRYDGRLLCAGGEETNVKLFDVPSKSLLRLFKGHQAPVHRTFFINERPQIASFSDDKTVKIWDIPTERNLITYSEHTDYIRAGATNPVVPDILVSGGYDSAIKMYDTRTNKVVLNLNHGSPIESMVFLQSGSIFISAGGTEIKIWDTIGGKLLGSISQHHKTITCLRLASDNKRLLSASLDRHVKIYDITTFKVLHTMDFPNSVLSLAVSNDDSTLVAGLTNGLVAISRRRDDVEPVKSNKKMASFKYATNIHQATVDLVIPEVRYDKETRYDHCLRKFEYSKALDSVLLPYVATKNPQITVSLMQELIRRHALEKAFRGRDSKTLVRILRFFVRNMCDYRFTKVLINAANILIDVYEERITELAPEVQSLFKNLAQLLAEEIQLCKELAQVQGTIHMLLAATSARTPTASGRNLHQTLTPSANAQKNLIVNLT